MADMNPVWIALIVAAGQALPVYLNYRSELRRTKEHKATTAAIEVVRKDVNGSNARALQVKGDAEHAKGVIEGQAIAAETSIPTSRSKNQN